MKKVKIMSVCGFGIGSSLILKMKIEKILEEEGLEGEVFCNDVTTAPAVGCDIIFTSDEIAKQLSNAKCPVIKIKNFIDTEEIREKGVDIIKNIATTKL